MVSKNWQNVIQDMSDEKAGKVLKMLYDLNVKGLEPSDEYFSDPELKWFYKGFVLPYTEDALNRYIEICQKRQAAGRTGGLTKSANLKRQQMILDDPDDIPDSDSFKNGWNTQDDTPFR